MNFQNLLIVDRQDQDIKISPTMKMILCWSDQSNKGLSSINEPLNFIFTRTVRFDSHENDIFFLIIHSLRILSLSRILVEQRPAAALSQDMPPRSRPDIETIGQVKRTLNTMPFSLCMAWLGPKLLPSLLRYVAGRRLVVVDNNSKIGNLCFK